MTTITIKKFLKVDSHNRREDGTEMTHREKYSAIVNAIGLGTCVHYIPATKEEVVEALKTDEYLNNIPIKKWDDQHWFIKQELFRIGINAISLSDTVCVLKEAARMWATREDDSVEN